MKLIEKLQYDNNSTIANVNLSSNKFSYIYIVMTTGAINIKNKMLTGINIRARFLVRKLNLSSELVTFFELELLIGELLLKPDKALGLLDI
jgi:hypothetical protein